MHESDRHDRVVPSRTLGQLIGLLYRAGLPDWRVLAAAATLERPSVVCDATDDIDLLAADPDLVLDGLHLVAAAVGVRRVHLCVPPGIGAVAVRRALAGRNDRVRTVVLPRGRRGEVVLDGAACARLAEVVRSTLDTVEMAP
jgi:hypothetical protein